MMIDLIPLESLKDPLLTVAMKINAFTQLYVDLEKVMVYEQETQKSVPRIVKSIENLAVALMMDSFVTSTMKQSVVNIVEDAHYLLFVFNQEKEFNND